MSGLNIQNAGSSFLDMRCSTTDRETIVRRHACIVETASRLAHHPALIQTWLAENYWGRSICLVSDSAIWTCFTDHQTGSEDSADHNRHCKSTTRIASQQFRTLLGQEFDVLVYDVFSGIHPDALAALSGCLKAGGIFIFYAPPLANWAEFEDPQLKRLLAYPLEKLPTTGYFLRYFQQKLQDSDLWIRLTPDKHTLTSYKSMLATGPTESPLTKRLRLMDTLNIDGNSLCSSPRAIMFQPDFVQQSACINKILTLASRPTAALVVSAGRGRGKSAALGISAARWWQQLSHLENRAEVWITAPNRNSVSTLFKHARLEWQRMLANSRAVLPEQILFLAPDDLLQRLSRQKKRPSLVMVDEAASIPLQLLAPLLTQIKRCVFAVTTHGYEGCGQGFRQKFIPAIKKLIPEYLHCQLKQPVRWMDGDPLEIFFNDALMLTDTTGKQPTGSQPATADRQSFNCNNLELTEYTSAFLLSQTDLLQTIFQLLTSAHYRTTPDDLRTLLDSPEVRIFAVSTGEQVLACLLLSNEQPFTEPDLREHIWLGKRRPKGHLIQQTFAQQLNIRSALELNLVRIVRIAVHPEWQRHGIGRWLLNQLPQYCPQRTALQGASYASEPSVNRFWLAQGYQLVRLGTKRDAFTGSHSALVVKALDSRGHSLVDCARKRFTKRINYDLLRRAARSHAQKTACNIRQSKNQDPRQIITGIAKSGTGLPETLASSAGFDIDNDELLVPSPLPLDCEDIQEMRFFAAGQRAYPAVADTLYRACLAIPEFTGNKAWQICVGMQSDLKNTSVLAGLSGQKATVSALREATKDLLMNYQQRLECFTSA